MRLFLPLLLCIASTIPVFAQKDCRHVAYEQKLLTEVPGLKEQYAAVEAFTNNYLFNPRSSVANGGGTEKVPNVIIIPVVVHILYNNANSNISYAQIVSQIESLNTDFRALNADKSKVPVYFQSTMADVSIEFKLANIDPNGKPTTGVVRKKTSIQYFSLDDRVKNSQIGGDDAWDAKQYLNIWVCNLAGGMLGYASAPGGPAAIDGVVLGTSVFGTVGALNAPFNKGRTATHEIGHWLNLRHIWGDTYCGDDYVDDTPKQRSPNRGCPTGEKFTCETTGHGDMYMNYMDFTDDACMVMFTHGQKQRMRALFASGGARNALLASKGLSGTDMAEAPQAPEVPVVVTKQINIYPNPAITTLTVQVAEVENCTGKTLTIYNHMGQPVASQVMKNNTVILSVGHLSKGMYFVKIGAGKADVLTKFVKM